MPIALQLLQIECAAWLPEARETEKKPETENLGQGRAGVHLIKFQVSRVTPHKARKIRVGSGYGYFRVFAHSNFDIDFNPGFTVFK